MKKFKQFRAEQQYITEVGPFASAMMAAMGVVGVGVAGCKLFKKAKAGIKGYRETKAERKQNPAGKEILVPEFNSSGPDEGKVTNTKVVKTKREDGWGGLTNKELKAFKQKFKDKADADKESWDIKNPDKGEALEREREDAKEKKADEKRAAKKAAQDTEAQGKADQDLEDEGEDVPIEDYVGADVDKIPKSKRDEVKGIESKEIEDGKGVVKWMTKWKKHVKANAKDGEGKINPPSGWSKVGPDGKTAYNKDKDGNKFSYKQTEDS